VISNLGFVLRLKVFVIVALLGFCETVFAGLLVAPHASWSSYAFRPLDEEPTPNYYGYGGGLQVGYSAIQMVDFAAFVDYTPGNIDAADPFDSNSELVQYGGAFGLRIYKALYIGFHGGIADYRLPVRARPEEVGGEWSGSAFGFKLGGLIPMTSTLSWQIALGMTTATVAHTNDSTLPERKIDHFSLSFTFVYNSEDSLGFVDAIFSNSIKSLFR
jgi:hypothetical protein